VYLGTGEHAARLRVLGSDALAPGSTGFVRIHLPVGVPLVPGDRYVLRESGRGETVGGGEVLDVEPVRRASKATPSRSVARVVAERGWIEARRLDVLTGEHTEPNLGAWVVDPALLAQRETTIRAAVADAGARGVPLSGMSELDRAMTEAMPDLAVHAGRAREASAQVEDLSAHPFVAALEASPYAPPSAGEVNDDRGDLRELVQRGHIVERDGFYFANAAVVSATHAIAALLAAKPDGVTVSEIRDALGTTRKYLLPLLAHLDATGVTRRRGDVRIAGPRLG
jgi:selenocysteine-specific elongation factor